MKNKYYVGVSRGLWKVSYAWVYAVTNEKQALSVGRVGVLKLYKV